MVMHKKSKVNLSINVSKRLLYTLIAIGILAIVGVGVYAFGGSQPSNVGHSAGELDLSGGVNGNAIFKGKVGIGISNPNYSLDLGGGYIGNGYIKQSSCYWTTAIEVGCSYSIEEQSCPDGYYQAGYRDYGLHNCACQGAEWECDWAQLKCCRI
jgi:hypothetical protein